MFTYNYRRVTFNLNDNMKGSAFKSTVNPSTYLTCKHSYFVSLKQPKLHTHTHTQITDYSQNFQLVG